MENEHFKIKISGLEVEDIYQDLVCLEVETGMDMTGMARMTLSLVKKNGGSWSYLDDERFTAWKRVEITAGFQGSMETLFSGFITKIKPNFARDISKSTLDVWVMDKRVRMDREENLKSWPNKSDSDIAGEILITHGFTPMVDPTGPVHLQERSTIIQRETDLQFLKRLAKRNGFYFYVEDDTAYFRKIKPMEGIPQPVLAVDFGEETSVKCFSIEVNALAPTDVSITQVDPYSTDTIASENTESPTPPMGSEKPPDGSAAGVPPAKIYPRNIVGTGKQELDTISRGIAQQGGWFVTAEGSIDANRYGHVLKAHKTVTIKGIGATYSGIYYVTHVTHSFSSKGYFQEFKVKRDALKPTGAENFEMENIF
jgi:hypothetical protein